MSLDDKIRRLSTDILERSFNRMIDPYYHPFYSNGLFEKNIDFYVQADSLHGPFELAQFNNKGLVAIWRIKIRPPMPHLICFCGPVYENVSIFQTVEQ